MSLEPRTSNFELSKPPAGYWQREVSHYPKPLTPLGSSFVLDGINQAFPKVCAEFGTLLETLEFREIGGYVYQATRPYGVGQAGGGRLPPKPVLWLVLRLHPAFRRRLARCREAIGSRVDFELIERWFNDWRPRLTSDIERWRRADLAPMANEELCAHLVELRRWAFEAMDIHFYLAGAYAYPLARLAFFCRDRLGWNDGQVMSLLSGLSEASSAPAVALAELAGHVAADGALKEAVLSAAACHVPSVLAQRSSALAATYDEYVHRYGCRALRYELVEQCMDERPELIAGLLQDQLRTDGDLQKEQERLAAARIEAKERALDALGTDEQRHEFHSLLAEAERSYPIREDNEFYTVSVPLALARRAVLEAGRRLTANGVLPSDDDVFFLRYDELVGALEGQAGQHRALIAQRRGDLAAAEAFAPPASYGEEPPQPPLDVLPDAWRTTMEVLLYSLEKVFEPERSNRRVELGARELKGVPAATGCYTGPARVIMGEEQFDKLQAGDVLVCPITSPVWSVLFAKVGALVTDTGGVLSHPAIIAREYGIPAVVATGNATQLLTDGEPVEVDGGAGLVRLLS